MVEGENEVVVAYNSQQSERIEQGDDVKDYGSFLSFLLREKIGWEFFNSARRIRTRLVGFVGVAAGFRRIGVCGEEMTA